MARKIEAWKSEKGKVFDTIEGAVACDLEDNLDNHNKCFDYDTSLTHDECLYIIRNRSVFENIFRKLDDLKALHDASK